jgi:MFS family permease
MFLLGLAAGSISDEFAKKPILIALQVGNLLVSLVLMLVLIFGSIHAWHAFAATFLTGVAWAVDFSVRRTYFATIFPNNRVENAISLDTASLTGSSILGPLLGGGIIAVAGFTGAYALMVGLYIAGLVLLISVNTPRGVIDLKGDENTITQIMKAFRLARSNQQIWAVVIVTLALNLFGFPYMQMVPVIARDVLGASEVLYGVLGSAAGVGSLLGSLMIASRRFRHQGAVHVFGALLMLVAVFLFAWSNFYPLSLICLFLAGIGMSGFAIMQIVMVLKAAPSELSGGAMGMVALAIGASPIGLLVVGQLAEVFGPQSALRLWSGLGAIVMFTLYWCLPGLRGTTD